MGTLRSTSSDPSGHVVNGVLLGEPVEIDDDPTTFEWDDSAFPTGQVSVVGGQVQVVPDEEPV